MNTDYLLFDIKRTARNRRVLIFSILMPLGLFLVFGMNLKGQHMDDGMSAAAYVMISMAMFGSMSAAMSIGGAIAIERDGGWNRTLRLTPLKPQSYILSKILLSLLLAVPPIVVVYLTAVLGADVRMWAANWATVTLAAWLGALPFAGLGLIIGYVAKPDSVQPISGLMTILVAAFGGLWVPIDNMPSLMKHIAELTPAYWTGLTARSPLTHTGFDSHALLVVLAWTVGLGLIGLRRFRADTARA
jgi:ABC-2 type transport system permease protein